MKIQSKQVLNMRKHGWDTPEKAIKGGADFIHKHFLSHDDQNTLYSMRWNPMNPGEHQYATDIKWAESNAEIIADFYKEMKQKVNTSSYMFIKMIKNITSIKPTLSLNR